MNMEESKLDWEAGCDQPISPDSPQGEHQDKELSVLQFNTAWHLLSTYYVQDTLL